MPYLKRLSYFFRHEMPIYRLGAAKCGSLIFCYLPSVRQLLLTLTTKWLLWSTALTLNLLCMAQQIPHRHFGLDEGLPGNTIYDLTTDDYGYLWIATDHGVARFDGRQFQVFDKTHALNDLEVLNLHKDAKGHIWLFPFSEDISMSASAGPYQWEFVPPPWEIPSDFGFREVISGRDSSMWLLGRQEKVIYGKGHHHRLFDLTRPDAGPHRSNLLADSETDAVYLLEIHPSGQKLHRIDTTGGTTPVSTEGIRLKPLVLRDDALLDSAGTVYKIHRGQLQPLLQLPPHLRDMRFGRVKTLPDGSFVVTEARGVFHLAARKAPKAPPVWRQILAGGSPNCMCLDGEGNLWVGTLARGLFRFPLPLGRAFGPAEGLPREACLHLAQDAKGQIRIGGQHADAFVYDGTRLSRTELPKFRTTPPKVYAFTTGPHGENWVCTAQGLYVLEGDRGRMLLQRAVKGVVPQGDRYVISTGQVLSWFRPHELPGLQRTTLADRRFYRGRVYALAGDPARGIWFSTPEGLFSLLGSSMIPHPRNGTLPLQRILAISPGPNSLSGEDLWLGTDGAGLLHLDGGQLHRWDRGDGLGSDACRSIFRDADGSIWVATTGGLSHLVPAGNDYVVHTFREADGLISDRVHDVVAGPEQIYLATAAGMQILPKARLRPRPIAVQPHFTYAGFDKGVTVFPGYPDEFRYGSDRIELHYGAVCFRCGDALEFRHRLIGADSLWTVTQAQVARYYALAPGKYRFELSARTPGHDWSPALQWAFRVPVPWYRSTWFRALCGVVVILLLSLFFYLRGKRREARLRRDAKTQHALISSQLTALRARMNPHFVFNAMTSIQHFIMQQDLRAANVYLSQFAMLIRKVLEMSERPYVRLSEEIEWHRLYLDLEKLRFEHKWDWTIVQEPDLEPELLLLPPLLLQPYVENAINHGLMHREAGGKLTIQLERVRADLLRCTIADDGIGRAAARALRTDRDDGHQPFAMSATRQRLAFLREQLGVAVEVQVEDRVHPDGSAAGTTVTMLVPVQQADFD